MRLIIVGASGLIGRSLFEAANTAGVAALGTYNDKAVDGLVHYDMQSGPLSTVVPDLGPADTVYILSAYSNPSWIFANQAAAKALNLTATTRLIDEVIEAGSRVIFMSSVEVFDGERGNYNEASLPKPLNLYGRMKHEVEKYLTAKNGRTCIVRTSWNVGWTAENRCVIKLTYETLLKPDAKMAKDNIFSIVDVRDTALGLLKLADKPELKICHFASTPPVVRTELADAIRRFSARQQKMSYKTVSFSDIPYSEPRGRCNDLDCSLARSVFGLKFRPPLEIIEEKVKLLDRMGK